MIARSVNAAADVIHRAQVNGTQTATGIAIVLESAETAAELERLQARVGEVERKYTFDTAELKRRIAELQAERADEHDELAAAVGYTSGLAWSDLVGIVATNTTSLVRAEQDVRKLRARVAELEALNRQMGRRGMKVYAQAVEAGQRVRELEAERQTVNEVLDDAAQTLRGRALIEDPHDGPLSHRYTVGRDLPQAGGAS